MEERLKNFISDHENFEELSLAQDPVNIPQDSIAIVRFVHHQVCCFIICK